MEEWKKCQIEIRSRNEIIFTEEIKITMMKTTTSWVRLELIEFIDADEPQGSHWVDRVSRE